MDNILCFSGNVADVKTKFKDYMYHFMSEEMKREGYTYDNSVSFADKENKMNNILKSEISRLSNVNFGENAVSVEAMSQNPMVRWASYAVVTSLIDMIIPEILVRDNGMYSEQRVIGYGDTALFNVEPNDLFYVSKAGMNQRTVEFQRQYTSSVTINPENRAITVAANLYKVLCGMESLARFVTKAVLSIEHAMNIEVYRAFDTALSNLPTTPVDGALNVTGWDETSAVKLAQIVSAYNGGSKAIFMGTALALRNILPKDANYRYFLDSDYVRLGYLRNFMGFDTFVMPQIADWENPYNTVLDDNKIYVISPASQKPVKIVLEGNSRANTLSHYDAADLTETTTLYKSWGVGIATNATVGIITLA